MNDNELNDDIYEYRDYRIVESIEKSISGPPSLHLLASTTISKGRHFRNQQLLLTFNGAITILAAYFLSVP
ncbi:19657_t:CDS:2 [Rhizophagus irregularis]|nr:19657_t:CDS:2 [Rhizophagus irregularis]